MRQQKELQKTKKTFGQNVFLGILIAFTGLILSLRLFLANNLVDKSVELAKLNKQIDALETEKSKLSSQNRTLTSFVVLQNKAMQLGFVKTDHYSYLPETAAVATNLVSPVN